MAQNIFRLVLTDEARNFIESLPESVSYKIYYNIKRVQVVNATRNFLRSWRIRKYGSFVHYTIKQLIAYSPFGIKTKRH